jgi:hypothetical protein
MIFLPLFTRFPSPLIENFGGCRPGLCYLVPTTLVGYTGRDIHIFPKSIKYVRPSCLVQRFLPQFQRNRQPGPEIGSFHQPQVFDEESTTPLPCKNAEMLLLAYS